MELTGNKIDRRKKMKLSRKEKPNRKM